MGIKERNLTITCSLKTEAVSLEWQKNEKSLPEKILYGEKSIIIPNLSLEDEGIYTCNGLHLYTYSYSLRVAGKSSNCSQYIKNIFHIVVSISSNYEM